MTGPAKVTLFHTATGSRRHLQQCPHLVGASPVLESDAADTREICAWSQNELVGTGRTYHATIAEALADFGAPQHARTELASLLDQVPWEKVFVPNSRSYVAVTRQDKAVAWAGKTFVDYSDRPIVLLPDYVGRDGDGGRAPAGVWGDTCPDCREQRSISGACGCD